jgi:hypothetical protein
VWILAPLLHHSTPIKHLLHPACSPKRNARNLAFTYPKRFASLHQYTVALL